MADTEKITINLGPVDLGRIDVLVDQGLYSNRTDLIKTAIRNQLDKHDPVVRDFSLRRSFSLGVMTLSRSELERNLAEGKRVSLRVIGTLHILDDVSPELASQAIDSISVRGVFRAPLAVKEALNDRIKG